jgi:hypothetical protein
MTNEKVSSRISVDAAFWKNQVRVASNLRGASGLAERGLGKETRTLETIMVFPG